MSQQFDVYETHDDSFVLVIQSGLLDVMQTRVVMALVVTDSRGPINERLNPQLRVGERTMVLMPQLAATLTLSELGKYIGSAAIDRDAITRAVDTLLSGI